MLEKQLIAQGAPTLAGLKTASLFSVPYTDLAGLSRELGRCRRVLAGKGLALRVLRRWPGRVLVYVYRPDCLCRDLAQPGVKAFLRRQGYSALEPEQALGRLCRRLRAGVVDFSYGCSFRSLASRRSISDSESTRSKFSPSMLRFGPERHFPTQPRPRSAQSIRFFSR